LIRSFHEKDPSPDVPLQRENGLNLPLRMPVSGYGKCYGTKHRVQPCTDPHVD
jgi:hypothetical protein